MSVYSATTSSNKYISLELETRVDSQSAANNTTTISWWLRVRKSGSSTSATWGQCSYSANINGEQHSGSGSVSVSPGGATALLSGTVTVPHNADGTKTLSVSGSISGKIVGSVSGSQVLTTIPRASSISAPTFTLGAAGTITINRAASGFTHTLEYWYGSARGTIVTKTSSTSVSWTPPVGLASQTPNATQGTGSLICTTYSGNTQVGQTSIAVKMQVPASVVPSISSVSIAEAVSGLASKFGAYVQGKSKLRVKTSAAGAYGSSISACQVKVADITYSGLDITTNAIGRSGAVGVAVTVTDSRGRSASKTVNVTFVAYSQPSISAFSVHRCNSDGKDNPDGDYASISYNFAVAAVGGKNSKSAVIQYKRSTASSWTTLVDLSSGAYSQSATTVPATSLTSDYQYDIRLTVSDYFGATTMTATLPSAEVILDILSSGDGLAIGKTAETADALDVAWKLIANHGAEIKSLNALPLIKTNGELKEDFNNYTIRGKYMTRSDNIVSNMANRPCYNAGTLYCIYPLSETGTTLSGAWAYLVQIYITHLGRVYTREASTNGSGTITWGSWKTYLHSENVKDYIVASGTSGIWTYLKYESGIAICYGKGTAVQKNVTNAWGNVYTSGSNSVAKINYPFEFKSLPVETVAASTGSNYYATWLMASSTPNSTTATGTYELVRGTTATNVAAYISYVVCGRWK